MKAAEFGRKLKNAFCDTPGDVIPTGYVGVLDGIRFLAILTVAHFHVWQQSWWTWNFQAPKWLKALGIEIISLEWLQRYGSFFVDMMILLTGFCLFLPYARYMIEGGDKRPGLPDRYEVRNFYIKRIARIVPSYYFCTLVYLIFFIIPQKHYAGIGAFFKDEQLMKQLFANLTFTQNLTAETYLSTPFNGALWTVAVEVQFYLIFPILAFCFRKKPMLTYFGMVGVSYYYVIKKVLPLDDGGFRWHFNQMPALLCVFANGMLGALLFVAVANNMKRSRFSGACFTFLAFGAFLAVRFILRTGPRGVDQTHWQLKSRFILSVFYLLICVGIAFSVKWVRKIFDNKVMHFLAGISYNLYIWHQVIAVKLKEYKIPYWEGEQLPNIADNRPWMHKYTVIVAIAAFAAAIAVTYLIEKPCAKLINKLTNIRRKEY
ncbi:MAG: acyltransferase [Clostridia bacterium]|nr:acyltransferase [Clostridia bacterium]MBP5729733.1 acyltransferase [Clostridia bacterium]